MYEIQAIQQHFSREWGFTPAKANKRLVLFAAVRQYADGDVFAHKRWSLLVINRASHCAEARILQHSAMDCSHACPPTKSTRPNGCKSKETEVQRVKFWRCPKGQRTRSLDYLEVHCPKGRLGFAPRWKKYCAVVR